MIIPCSSEEPAFLRYGNFCYAGVIDVRQARGELDRVPSVIQGVHRQQGSLPFLCRSSDLPEMWRSKLGAIRAASEFVLEQLSSGDGGGGEGGSGGSGAGGMEGKMQELAQEGGQDWMLQEEDTEDAMFELATDAVREMRGIDFALLATFHRAMLVKTVWLGAGLGRASEDGAGNAGGMRYGRDTVSREEGGGRFLITIDNGEGEHTLVDTDFMDPSRSRSAGCQVRDEGRGCGGTRGRGTRDEGVERDNYDSMRVRVCVFVCMCVDRPIVHRRIAHSPLVLSSPRSLSLSPPLSLSLPFSPSLPSRCNRWLALATMNTVPIAAYQCTY